MMRSFGSAALVFDPRGCRPFSAEKEPLVLFPGAPNLRMTIRRVGMVLGSGMWKWEILRFAQDDTLSKKKKKTVFMSRKLN